MILIFLFCSSLKKNKPNKAKIKVTNAILSPDKKQTKSIEDKYKVWINVIWLIFYSLGYINITNKSNLDKYEPGINSSPNGPVSLPYN